MMNVFTDDDDDDDVPLLTEIMSSDSLKYKRGFFFVQIRKFLCGEREI